MLRWPPKPIGGLGILAYEAEMFFGLVAIALDADRFGRLGGLLLKNAVVESAVLHARGLCGIFLNEGRKDEVMLKTLLLKYQPGSEEERKIDNAPRQGSERPMVKRATLGLLASPSI